MLSNLNPQIVFELLRLKHVPRSGWALLGIPENESVADHTYGVMVMALLLASQHSEEVALDKVLLMALIHDWPEARLGDLHHVAQAYVDWPEANRRAFADQVEQLPLGTVLETTFKEYLAQDMLEAQLVKEADRLDLLGQALQNLGRVAAAEKLSIEWLARLQTPVGLHLGKQLVESACEAQDFSPSPLLQTLLDNTL